MSSLQGSASGAPAVYSIDHHVLTQNLTEAATMVFNLDDTPGGTTLKDQKGSNCHAYVLPTGASFKPSGGGFAVGSPIQGNFTVVTRGDAAAPVYWSYAATGKMGKKATISVFATAGSPQPTVTHELTNPQIVSYTEIADKNNIVPAVVLGIQCQKHKYTQKPVQADNSLGSATTKTVDHLTHTAE